MHSYSEDLYDDTILSHIGHSISPEFQNLDNGRPRIVQLDQDEEYDEEEDDESTS